MRLWDLRVPHCQGLLEVPSGIPTAAYDLQVGMQPCCQPSHTKEANGRQKKHPTLDTEFTLDVQWTLQLSKRHNGTSVQCSPVTNRMATNRIFVQGLVFCVGLDCGIIKLYDVRSFDKGPFSTFVVGAHCLCLLFPIMPRMLHLTLNALSIWMCPAVA